MIKHTVIMILLVCLTAALAHSAEANKKYGDLRIIHHSGEIENETYKYKQLDNPTLTPLKPHNSYTIRYNETVVLSVKDPNLFLYEYKWNSAPKEKTQNFAELERVFLGGGLHLRFGGDVDQKAGWYANISFNILDVKLK